MAAAPQLVIFFDMVGTFSEKGLGYGLYVDWRISKCGELVNLSNSGLVQLSLS